MVKRFFSFIFILLILLTTIPSYGQTENLVFLDDNREDYFSQSQADDLSAKLEEISDKHNADFVIIFKENVGNAQSYAEDYFEKMNLGRGQDRDGVLLLINMAGGYGNRDIYIATHGVSKNYISESKVEKLLDTLIDNGLGQYQYYKSLSAYINKLDKIHRGNYISLIDGIIALVSGGIVSGTYALGVKKSYKASKAGKKYMMENNAITNYSRQNDIFIREYTRSRTIPKQSSSGSGGGKSSGGGSSFGGGGRKF